MTVMEIQGQIVKTSLNPIRNDDSKNGALI